MNNKLVIVLILLLTLFSCGSEVVDPIILSGEINTSEIDPGSNLVFIIISNTDDFEKIENDPVNTVIAMITVNNDNSFSIDLSDYGIDTGDVIYIVAFVDNDYNGGIPFPTENDYIGLYFNDSTWDTAYTVSETNINLNIDLNRKVYDFETSIQFKMNQDDKPGDLANGDSLIAIAVHEDGVNGTDIDMDYIIGMDFLEYTNGTNHIYTLNILNYIDTDIGENLQSGDEMNINIFVLFDRNGDGKPGTGEDIASYWAWLFFFYPKVWTLELDTINILSDPDNVRFINQTF